MGILILGSCDNWKKKEKKKKEQLRPGEECYFQVVKQFINLLLTVLKIGPNRWDLLHFFRKNVAK